MIELDWRSCQSMAEEIEQVKMEEWVRLHHEKLGRDLNILEVGSYLGQSTVILAQFGKVFAVDLWGNIELGLHQYNTIGQVNFIPFIQNIIRLNLIERVIPVVSTSAFLKDFPNLMFDVMYLDGGHSYECVKQDLEIATPHLNIGGLLLMDDYCRTGWGFPPFNRSPTDPWAGVAQAVDEFLTNNSNFKIKEHYLGKLCIVKVV